MNRCLLEIYLRFFEFNGEYMGAKIQYDNLESTLTPTDDSIYCYQQQILLPCTIGIEFFGKQQGKDTAVDSEGNVLKDKHVVVKAIKLDSMPVDQLYIKRRLKLNHVEGPTYSNYIGFNGHLTLTFEKSNVFNQILHMKHLGEYQ